MVQSVLGSLTLGYRPLWNAARRLAAIQLYVQDDPVTPVDASHLLRTLQELWSASSPPLLISPLSHQLLFNLLEQAPRGSPWIEVRGDWLSDSAIYSRVEAAHRRGLKMVWRGELSHLPPSAVASFFDNSLLSLSPQEAIAALQAGPGKRPSPVIDRQMYENLPNAALASHCLDQHQAVAIAGWPAEDVLYGLRHKQLQPAHASVLKLMKAIDGEQSIEALEQILGEEPLLAYRFMLYTNSAALGLRTGVDSLRRGLVMLGYSTLKRWLAEQLPHATHEPDLQPIRESMVLRAKLAERLIEAGVSHDLRREVYLMGLFSQLGELLREPQGAVLRRLPLSERIVTATLQQTGPYAGVLEMACALENDDPKVIQNLCEKHEFNLENVNRVLLRVLCELTVERPHSASN
jgi:EAL and modified HD-GYP domain-containing signal transduction protein